ncbi:hypothetical protein CHLNCDRAFT_51000 [Chlorella variabilis]|uniref:N-acetyltransferase domain-containing protein n=1 Tax=Chlorella variabilis TaxID=554065 RepID=E1Z959_CHLVA|nr:hypothetical protein CHLNCDRAFT_51000 [Chlorella variabilis]EFN57722.1 hypothetical protein CHLNCDRAFT_51000 [Chlorella variabilis]|eukprot:XP_005849824.1 hypothetical protein CHLNCDRAFT_51000 [Chlorella variabilis]
MSPPPPVAAAAAACCCCRLQCLSAGYPPDEAASRERLLYRLENAADQFLVAVKDDQIVGFICGTLTKADRLTEDSMGQHEPDGGLLAIHSVAVDAAHRRQRVATRLLQAYKAYVCSSTPCLTTLRLICKEPLLSLYKNCGFQMVGPSAVVHGKDPWFEMRWEERRFTGGETMLLQPDTLDYWRNFDPHLGTETPQLVEGTRDPLEARVVLHGWFTQPDPFFAGSLREEEATPALNACLDVLFEALSTLPPSVGTVTLQLTVEGSGRVADICWKANTLVARPQSGEAPTVVTEATLACIAEHLLRAQFPPSHDGGCTAITLPFVFQ